jgi:cytochrome c oxidase assembly factor CtaG
MITTWWCVASDAPWSWRWRPYLGAWLLATLLLLMRGRMGWRSGRGYVQGSAVWFLLGVLCVWSATDWPIAGLGAGYLLTAHTIQYLMLGLAGPALLVLGVPPDRWERLLAEPGRAAVVTWLTHPVVALAGFTVILVATHLPAVLDRLMASQRGSFAFDMMWLLGGILLWLPVLAPPLALPVPARVGYLAIAAVPHAIPAAFLVFSDYPLYRRFELAPRVAGIAAGVDQQIAGAVMNVGSMLVLGVAFTLTFFHMARREE